MWITLVHLITQMTAKDETWRKMLKVSKARKGDKNIMKSKETQQKTANVWRGSLNDEPWADEPNTLNDEPGNDEPVATVEKRIATVASDLQTCYK